MSRSHRTTSAAATAIAGFLVAAAPAAWAQDPPPDNPGGQGADAGVRYVPEAISLRYGPPMPWGITAFVGVPGIEMGTYDCTYEDGVNPPRPFTIDGPTETRLDIFGIPLGRTYHVVVTCDGWLKHEEDKVF